MPNEAITAAGASGTPGITLCSAGLRRVAVPGAAPGWSRLPRLDDRAIGSHGAMPDRLHCVKQATGAADLMTDLAPDKDFLTLKR